MKKSTEQIQKELIDVLIEKGKLQEKMIKSTEGIIKSQKAIIESQEKMIKLLEKKWGNK